MNKELVSNFYNFLDLLSYKQKTVNQGAKRLLATF